MAAIVCSGRALAHLERAFELLRTEHPEAPVAAADAIRTAVESLAAHPLLGQRVHGDIRELVISYGRTGYIALYRFLVPQDEVRVLAIRHQREIGFVPSTAPRPPRGRSHRTRRKGNQVQRRARPQPTSNAPKCPVELSVVPPFREMNQVNSGLSAPQ
jgi:plasmid stabilization system protein ParE